MKSWILITLIIFMAFPTPATSQRSRVPDQHETGEPVQVTDFTSESESSDGTIYIVGGNYYVASSWASLKAKMGLDSKDVSEIKINMTDNPIPANQVIIEYERSRLPENYRDFVAIARVILNREKR